MQQSFDSRSNSVGVQTSYLHLYCALNLLSSVKSDSPQLVLQLWKEEEVTRREIRRIGWMLNHLPVPGIKHVKQGSRDVHRRIVMQEDDAVLQQLSTLLSDGRSQHFTDDPLLVRSVDSRTWRHRPVEKNSMDIEEHDVHDLQRGLLPDRFLWSWRTR